MTTNDNPEDQEKLLKEGEKGKDPEQPVEGVKKEEPKEEEQQQSSIPDFSIGRFIIAMLFECVGIFLFMCAILLGSGPEATIISFWIIITMISPFSGGHVNPAVTFGCYIYDMKLIFGLPKLVMYILAQLVGGSLALMYCTQIRESSEIAMFKHDVEYKEFMSEFFFTGTFIFVILYCCSPVTRVSTNRALTCVIISAWLYYAATSAGKRSVGALNPAVLSAFTIYNNSITPNYYDDHKKDIWYMIYAQFGAALLFALIFFLVEKMFPQNSKEEEKSEEKVVEKS